MALVTLLFHPQDLLALALDLLDRDATLTGRTAMWAALWPLIEARFWLGNGYMAFWDHAPDYFGAASWMARFVHAHNTYVQLLLDLGAAGLASLLLLLLTIARGLLHQARHGDADALTLLGLLLTLAFIGLAGDIFLRPNTGQWVMLVAIALYASDPPPKAPA
jgi:O-antigen ligase